MFGRINHGSLTRIIALSVGVVVTSCWAQNSNSSGYVAPPLEFLKFMDEELASKFERTTSGGCDINLKKLRRDIKWGTRGEWKVYTVRNKTPLFVNEEDEGGGGLIDFAQRMKVIQVGESRLKVTFVDGAGGRSGWVDACDVLLWSKPIARAGGFPRRVIALSQLSRSGQSATSVASFFLKDPREDAAKAARIKGLEVLYIMKEVTGRDKRRYYLLSRSSNSENLQDDIRGWLPSDQLTAWDTRVAYWENHSRTGEGNYGDNPVPLFGSDEGLTEFLAQGNLRDTLQTRVLRRNAFNVNRMLHLESNWNVNQGDDTRKLELFTIKNPVQSDISKGEANERMGEWRKKMKSINVHFLLDATASMDKNVTAIKYGVDQFLEKLMTGLLREELGETTLQLGASVYRGVEDGNDIYDLSYDPTEIKSVASAKEVLSEFVAALDAIKFQSDESDRTLEESLFWGISGALQDGGFEKGATNFLIVIGDAGDDGQPLPGNSALQKAEVSKLLVEADVDLMMLQSTNGFHPAFDSFVRDGLSFLDELESDDGNLSSEFYEDDKNWQVLSTSVGTENTTLKNEGVLILNLEVGSTLKPEILGEFIADKIEGALVRSIARWTEFRKKVEGDSLNSIPEGWFPDDVDPTIYGFDERSVKAWGRETYYGESVGAFVPYVYMESGVLKDFRKQISELYNLSPERFYFKLQAFLQEYSSRILGLDKSDPEVLDMTMFEVWKEAFNVPFLFEELGKIPIREIGGLVTKTKDNPALNAEVQKFQKSCENFKTMPVKQYKYVANWDGSESGLVYWIPGSKFPGMAASN